MTSDASDRRAPVDAIDIDRLISALDHDIGPIATTAALQLHAVLPRLGATTPERHAGAIVAIVAKSHDTTARIRAAALAWARALRPLASPTVLAQPIEPTPRAVVAAPRRPRLLAGLVAASVAALVVVAVATHEPQLDPAVPDARVAPQPDASLAAPDAGLVTPEAAFDDADAGLALPTFPMPSVRFVPATAPADPLWPDLALAALALAVFIGLLTLAHRWASLGDPLPVADGPPAGPPPRAPPVPDHLLDRDAEELLVWGIDRYTGTEETRRLDVRATVRATAARGGLPTLVRRHARHHREVWLWRDLATDDPALAELVAAVATTLRRSNLPVEVSRFHGVPDALFDDHDDGATWSPAELDERRDTARVAILTDGALLAERLRRAATAPDAEAALRALARWPAVAFFETGPGTHRLDERLAPFALTVLPADRLIEWLGGGRRARVDDRANETTLWAAGLALSPQPVDPHTALALRDALALTTPATGLGALAEETGGGGRLWWPSPLREQRLTWLVDAIGQERMATLRAFWIERFEAAATLSDTEGAEASPSERPMPPRWHAMKASAALVALWDDDTPRVIAAVDALHQHHEGAAGLIEQQLARLTPADEPHDPSRARLPWPRAPLPLATRLKLRELGLGSSPRALADEAAPRPGRAWAAIGAALAVIAAGVAGLLTRPPPSPAPGGEITAVAPSPADAARWDLVTDLDGRLIGRRRLALALAAGDAPPLAASPSTDPIHTNPGEDIIIDWRQPTPTPCRQQRMGHPVWLCGTREPTAPPAGDWPPRSVVLLDASPDDRAAARLATRLLDHAAADQVWFTQPAAPDGAALAPALAAEVARLGGQLIHITRRPDDPPVDGATRVVTADWRALTRAIGDGEAQPIAEVWPMAAVTGAALLPAAGCRAGEQRLVGGVPFRCVPAGVYWIGSDDGDDDERPRHRVRLDEYWIAETETTQAQYRALTGESPSWFKGDDRPVEQVIWDESRAYCQKLGCRLPTEAEWEVACRAGTETKWSTGDDEAGLGAAAWYGPPASATHPVGTKAANAWGLHDLHGNVWEWVEDDYAADAYRQRAEKVVINPTNVPPIRGDRVLRGGSFFNPAVVLRSSDRDWGPPSSRLRNFGFRCVCIARQQQPLPVAP